MNVGFGEIQASREDVDRAEIFRVGSRDFSWRQASPHRNKKTKCKFYVSCQHTDGYSSHAITRHKQRDASLYENNKQEWRQSWYSLYRALL